jgi:hypothetical protein
LFGGKRAPVRLAFDVQAEGARTPLHRTEALQGVSKGAYLLTVKLTDPSRGATLVRTRRFTVVGR